MNCLETLFSGLLAIFSSFVGSFAGGGSTPLLLAFFLYSGTHSFLVALTLAKVSAFALTVVSGSMHRRKQFIDWKLCLFMCLFGGLGTALATYAAQYELNEIFLKQVVALILFLLGMHALFSKGIPLYPSRATLTSHKELFVTSVVFFLLNLVNGLTGGMGIAFVIFCTVYLKTSFIQASAYSMLSGILVIGFQSVYLVSLTHPPLVWMVAVVLGSMIGAYLGTKLQYLKGDRWIKWASTLVIFVLAFLLLV